MEFWLFAYGKFFQQMKTNVFVSKSTRHGFPKVFKEKNVRRALQYKFVKYFTKLYYNIYSNAMYKNTKALCFTSSSEMQPGFSRAIKKPYEMTSLWRTLPFWDNLIIYWWHVRRWDKMFKSPAKQHCYPIRKIFNCHQTWKIVKCLLTFDVKFFCNDFRLAHGLYCWFASLPLLLSPTLFILLAKCFYLHSSREKPLNNIIQDSFLQVLHVVKMHLTLICEMPHGLKNLQKRNSSQRGE